MERSKVFLQLERGIELLAGAGASQREDYEGVWGSGCRRTSFKGIRGGPAAMSFALVPRWILRFAFASSRPFSICDPCRLAAAPPDGEPGPIWISAVGGGLGSRGELGGIAMGEVRGGIRQVFGRFGCASGCWPSVAGRKGKKKSREFDVVRALGLSRIGAKT